MMHVSAENVGAERALCILCKDDQFLIEDKWPPDSLSSNANFQIEGDTLFCESVVKLVSHTRKPFMIEDAAKDTSWSNDQYIRQNMPRSIMCVPIVQNAEFMGCVSEGHLIVSLGFDAVIVCD